MGQRRHGDVTTGCPLCPQKRTSSARSAKSALCHVWKWLPLLVEHSESRAVEDCDVALGFA
jgi:hypothetical protein